MENRPQTLVVRLKRGLLPCLLLWVSALSAQEPSQPVDIQALLKKGLALQEQAASLRDRAEKQRAREDEACGHKFLVNDCRNGARERYLEQVREARAMETEGRTLERQARLEERELLRQQREVEEARQARELPLQQKEQETLRQSREAARDKRLADKETKAREGAKTRTERRIRQEEKQAKHAQKVQERMEKAEQRQNKAEPAPAVSPPQQP